MAGPAEEGGTGIRGGLRRGPTTAGDGGIHLLRRARGRALGFSETITSSIDLLVTMQLYILSKRLAEEVAFRFVRENGLSLVSVVLPTVPDPFLTKLQFGWPCSFGSLAGHVLQQWNPSKL